MRIVRGTGVRHVLSADVQLRGMLHRCRWFRNFVALVSKVQVTTRHEWRWSVIRLRVPPQRPRASM